jgi:two-component system, LytTR family, sensor kinase
VGATSKLDYEMALNRQWWLRAGMYIATWTIIALLSGAETFVAQLLYDKPVAWTIVAMRSLKEWYSLGLLALGVLWLGQRIRLETGRFVRWFAIHFGASLAFAPAYVALLSWLMTGEKSVQDGSLLTFPILFRKFIVFYFLWDVLMYWVVVLGQFGWRSYRDFRERERQAAALATELVQARLQALRMQINPHFLFNTLNTISALIHENPDAADRMVVRLSELLRHTFERGDTQEVPLREEMKFLEGYLEIQQMRFGHRLTVDIDVAPDVQDLLVPFLLLQPLVENAIRHGIEPREDPGRVTIRARRDGDRLELRIKDNGDGLPAEKLREGIGLTNTRSRLTHLYDEEASFDLVNAPGGGLEVRVYLPVRTTPEPFSPKIIIMSRRDLPANVLPDAQ